MLRSRGLSALRHRILRPPPPLTRAMALTSAGTLRYETLDVFTDTPCGGNPLAVVYGADDLPDESLLKIAREFNYSETTFVLPPDDPSAAAAKVRIFTPSSELPFAGHPAIGTACALGWRAPFGQPIGDRAVLQLQSGLVPVSRLPDGWWQLEAPLPFTLSSVGEGMSVNDAASCLGLEPADLRSEGRLASLGGAAPYALVELSGAAALQRCSPNASELARCGKVLAWTRAEALGASAAEEAPPDLRCRMFNARGVEDPATGAANCCLLGLLATLGSATGNGADENAPSTFSRRIAQGVEMGRPSLLLGECEQAGRWPRRIAIAGRCVPMMSGVLRKEYFV